MSCSECRGYSVSHCPICSPETRMVECPDCGGKGKFYYAFDIDTNREVEVTEAAYRCLPDTEALARKRGQHFVKYDTEVCETCDGEGEVECEELDYEPDYD